MTVLEKSEFLRTLCSCPSSCIPSVVICMCIHEPVSSKLVQMLKQTGCLTVKATWMMTAHLSAFFKH